MNASQELIRESDEALKSYHDLCKISSPTKHDLEILRTWLHHPRGGDSFLQDVEGDAWDRERVPMQDLVAMSALHHDRDPFTMFLSDTILSKVVRLQTILKRFFVSFYRLDCFAQLSHDTKS